MDHTLDVAVIVGSLRKESVNLKMAKAMQLLAPPTMKLDIVPIIDLPIYNQDLETDNPPEAWTTFRERIKRSDGVLFVTPEHNRSIPAAMKNAIDVGSRPKSLNIWNKKPGAVVSVTPGALGAFGAHHQLRQALVAVNVLTMAQPEMYIAKVGSLLDEQGNLVNQDTKDFLTKFLQGFEKWILRLVHD